MFYKKVIEHVHDIVFKTDNVGNWIYLNESWKETLGFPVEESIGKEFYSYLHPNDVEKNFLLFKPLVDGIKKYCNHEIRYVHKDGHVVWMNVFAVLDHDETTGEITGTIGTLRDITLEKSNRDLLEILSDNMTDMVCMHGPDGMFKYVSPSIYEIIGFNPIDMIGKNPYDFFHPEDIDRIRTQHLEVLETRNDRKYHVEYRFRTSDDSYKWVESTSKVVYDDNQDPKYIITSTRDITYRKEAEEQVNKALSKEKELNMMKSNLISFTSHQFKTPLACIQTSAELMEMHAGASQELLPVLKQNIEKIYDEVGRMNSMVDEMLLVSKVESNSFLAKKEPIYLEVLLQKIITKLEGLDMHDRKFIFETEGEHRLINADATLLTHAFTNVLENAIKYSPNTLSPMVNVQFKKKNVLVRITDFGIGIKNEDKKNIFKPFFRASNAQNTKGNGMGLFIAKNFLELNSGDITFSSTQGQSTIFTIKLAL